VNAANPGKRYAIKPLSADGNLTEHARPDFPVECEGSGEAAYSPSGNALLEDDGSLTPTRTSSNEPLTVLATNFELIRIAEGHELTFRGDDGTPVIIRLYSTDELLKAQRAAALTLEAETGVQDPGMTRQQAAQLCEPLGTALTRLGWLPR
jgi:hypothetical protein